MYRHHFISALICLLLLIVGSQHVSAQSQLAQDAYAIFEASCLNCHGSDGAFRETLLMEHNALIRGGTVVPGDPDVSEFYKRLLGPTENGAQMPFGLPQLPAQSIETVRRWILAGAPDWTATSTPDRRFIPPGEVLKSIESHLNSLSSFDRSFARYFTMTHLYNAGATPDILGEYRKALSKLVNSLSWRLKITNPQPIDPHETIFYIDLRHYEWDRNDGWTKIEQAYPYHISFDAPAHLALRNQLGRLLTAMECNVPSVHIDWFIATASTPPLYHDLLSLPLTDRELETRLEVDVTRNLRDAPGVEVWRAGFNNSGVSNHNRVVERHTSRYGAYWKSYDFAGSVGTQNIFTHPLNFTHDGGEIVFNLPNGLQGYYLADSSGIRLNAAPISIVSNPAASDPTVRNGISCIGCHTEGMKTFEDQVRSVIESNANPPYNKAHALRLYVEKSEMDVLVEEDMSRYREALEATGGEFGGVEPISRFHEAFQGPVDAAYAAAVVGLPTETFIQRVRENTGLQNLGLLALADENGNVKRDTWTSSFRDVMYALDYPGQVGEPPVITDPDVLPGTVVQIPDPTLRIMIAEELGDSPNAPLTVEDMERLRRLLSLDRRVHDLTGLQLAKSLTHLELDNSKISDLSALRGLPNLEFLEVHGEFSDLSPLAESFNLRGLEIGGTNVSDLSPISRLVNLRSLDIGNTKVSDVSVFAGLTNLQELNIENTNIPDLSPLTGLSNLKRMHFSGTNQSVMSFVAGQTTLEFISLANDGVSDISPLAGLTNLKGILTWGNPISDLSPLAGLTKLELVDICGAELSDLSPMAGLTRIKELYLVNNGITDIRPIAGLSGLTRLNISHNQISNISPLAGLTNLKWVAVDDNNISDFSPLDALRANTKIVWHDNPGYPKGGSKIEGPWLWVNLPETRLGRAADLLSEATGGRVTEERIATNGATLGKPIGSEVWIANILPSTDRNNIGIMLDDGVIYGTVSIYSPREQKTRMHVGNDEGLKVWLNGDLVYEVLGGKELELDFNDFFPVTLRQGKNVLLVAVFSPSSETGAFFGFESGTEYTVTTGIDYGFSQMPIHTGDTFTFDIRAENVSDLAGWQFDIAFAPTALEALDVSEGDFLKTDGGSTFFQSGRIDNANGKIMGLNAALLSDSGVSGSGTILHVKFKAKSEGETSVALENFLFGSFIGENISAGPLEIHFVVKERLLTGDINRDGRVNILDLILVARQLGKSVAADSPEDVNGDGIVNIFDLTLVAQGIGGAAAPGATMDATIEAWIAQARLLDDGSIIFAQGIENLENLLASLTIPQETALLANYPNPFNPETWIPYQLAAPAEVALTIYDMNGAAVQRMEIGHQAAGLYQNQSRAAYWDGRNQDGESVASGLYFYTLRAGEFTATRKMLIRK